VRIHHATILCRELSGPVERLIGVTLDQYGVAVNRASIEMNVNEPTAGLDPVLGPDASCIGPRHTLAARLTALGLAAVAVERCPVIGCEVCDRSTRQAA
jgi:hypothetical protein